MTGKELLFGLSDLDDALLDEALTVKPHRNHISGWIAMAACAVLIIAASVPFALQNFGGKGSVAPQMSVAEESVETVVESEPTEAAENRAFLPASAGNAAPESMPKMIEDYHFEPDMAVCYAAPKNGEIVISAHLQGAIDEYGDEPIYRVVIDLFDSEQHVELTDTVLDEVSAELTAQGYTAAIEKAYLWDEPTGVYLTIHATADQVRDFPLLAQYGVMLSLYGERAPIGDAIGDVAYSSTMN